MKANNVYIATLPRSGSTLLGLMLGAHSQVCHIGESAYWAKLDACTTKCCCGVIGCQTLMRIAKRLSDFPAQREGIHTACSLIDLLEEPHKVRHPLSLSAQAKNIDAQSLELAIQICCRGLDILTGIAREVTGKQVVVENSKYLRIAEALISNRDNWRVIVIIRDPRGVALSSRMAGARKNIPRPIEDKLDIFLSFAQRAYALIQQSPVALVRYEDLCRNPVGTLETVCDFIGVTFEDTMLKFKEHKGHLLMGNRMIYDNHQEIQEDTRWRSLLTVDEKALFVQRELMQAYGRFGYDLTKND